MKKRNAIGLIFDFMSAYPSRTVIMLVCLVLAGFAEGIGIMTLLPVIEVIDNEPNSSEITQIIASIFNWANVPLSIGSLLVFISIIIIIKAQLMLVAMLQAGYTIAQVTTDLRKRVIHAVLGAQWQYFIDHPVGAVSNSIATESQRASQAYNAACLMMAELIQLVVYAVIALTISPIVTLVAIAVAPLMFFIFTPLIRYARTAGNQQTSLQRKIIEWITHGLQGIKPIKAMGKQSFIEPVLEKDVESLNQVLRKQTLATQAVKTQQEPVLIIGLSVVLYFLITIGEAEFSSLLVLVVLFYRLIGKITGLQKRYQNLVINESAYWALNDIAVEAEIRQEQLTGEGLAGNYDQISFQNVGLQKEGINILETINLSFPSKGVIVLVGPSGAGKTTLIDLLARLSSPTSGEIFIDDKLLDSLDLQTWREYIGYVPQEMTLFHETVRNNLNLGEKTVSDQAIWHVLDLAGLSEFIATLPEKLDTTIGESGARFSGGQRQRLSIARALLRKPKILILDEVTTSLDPQTEQLVCEQLSSLSKKMLIIAISHQPAIQQIADQIIYLEGGKVIRVIDNSSPEATQTEKNL